jgi:DNA-binding MarR family transcriptional regulator
MIEFTDPTQVLQEWLALFMRRSVHDMLQYNKSVGLSPAQANILLWLHYHNSCDVTALAENMQVSAAAASQMVERMVQQGIVQRVESPSDRRTRQVHLTERGRQVVEETIAARQGWIKDLVKTLNEEQKTAVVKLLGELIQKAQAME